MTTNDLISLGFTRIDEEKSKFSGEPRNFYKKVNKDHVIENHDTTHVYLSKDLDNITIEIDHRSSYDYEGKRLVYEGRCKTKEFLEELLKNVI